MQEYILRIRGIRLRALVGASRDERSFPQGLFVDLDLTLPDSSFPKRDRRSEVVDYDRVVTCVVEVAQARPHHLLETFASRVLDVLFAETPAEQIRVVVKKAHAPTTHPIDTAAVELSRTR